LACDCSTAFATSETGRATTHPGLLRGYRCAHRLVRLRDHRLSGPLRESPLQVATLQAAGTAEDARSGAGAVAKVAPRHRSTESARVAVADGTVARGVVRRTVPAAPRIADARHAGPRLGASRAPRSRTRARAVGTTGITPAADAVGFEAVQDALLPLHRSATSQDPASERQTKELARNAFPGHAPLLPVHVSATSQPPAVALHSKSAGRNPVDSHTGVPSSAHLIVPVAHSVPAPLREHALPGLHAPHTVPLQKPLAHSVPAGIGASEGHSVVDLLGVARTHRGATDAPGRCRPASDTDGCSGRTIHDA
jgi:hypothetical protein